MAELTATIRKHTILVVDDTPAVLRMLTEHLEFQGYSVFVATDGLEAVERALLVRPDLILLDVMMPVQDGIVTARQLRAAPELSRTPILFMTSLHDIESKVAAFSAGAVDYITKPLQLDEVSMRLRSHLAICSLRDQLEKQNQELQLEASERKRAEEALLESHLTLELRVRERTRELALTNERLIAEIQERQKAESNLRQVQKMEAFGQLAGGVAHDFNNILTVILGQAECAQHPDATLLERLDALKEIDEAAQRASNLTRQLLVFSRQ